MSLTSENDLELFRNHLILMSSLHRLVHTLFNCWRTYGTVYRHKDHYIILV